MRILTHDLESIKVFISSYLPALAVIALWDIAVIIVGTSIALKLWGII